MFVGVVGGVWGVGRSGALVGTCRRRRRWCLLPGRGRSGWEGLVWCVRARRRGVLGRGAEGPVLVDVEREG